MLDGGLSPNASLNLLTRQAGKLLNPSPQSGEGDLWAWGLKGDGSPGQQDCIPLTYAVDVMTVGAERC